MSSPPAPNVFLAPSSPGPETSNVVESATPVDVGPSGTRLANGDGGGDAATDEAEANGYGRESMYVTLFDEMITTVLESESYLFTPRELWVLRYILSLPYGPHYLLTRLLLRRPGKVHAFSTIVPAYSSELGEEGVNRAARALCAALDIPEDIVAAEPEPEPEAQAEPKPRPSPSPSLGKRKRSEPAVANAEREVKIVKKTTTPWADISTGLSEAEERADPDLAEAIRQSLWAGRGGVEVIDVDAYIDANGAGPSGPRSPPETPKLNRSQSEPSMVSRAPSILPERSPSHSESTPDTDTACLVAFSLIPKSSVPITRLARSEADLCLDDLMSCVSGDDLRRVARARKIPLSALSTRDSTMRALRDAACRQTTLGFAPLKNKGKGKGRADAPGVKRSLSSASTSEHLVVAQLLPLVGEHVIQIDAELYTLVARVNLIFSRTPPASSAVPALILPPILVQSHKRHYPDYGPPTPSRIWADRDELLTWQRVTDWEALVSDALGDQWAEQRRGGGNPGWGPRGMPPSRTDGAKMVRNVWEEAWPIWKRIVAEDVDGKRDEPPGLAGDRFRTAHVLTRIVYKGAEALGVLHEYDLECAVLRSLLAQRRWRRGRRGAWYERLALVLMNHFKGGEAERTARLEDATQVCIDGLLDDDTHLIYRPSLSRRLTRLENKLNLPSDERHISFAQLLVCETRELYAPRVLQNAGKPVQRDRRGDDTSQPDDAPPAQVGKSVWTGREGEVTVEGWVLEWWEDRGYSGYHAESSILTTLFALLVWPVLFHPLPGAFETRYQTAPLDLGTDTFASARRALLDARLAEMENTSRALEMLHDADARERPRGTWAVGLSWDFGATELAEIVTCLGGPAVAAICRMLSEEYRHRASGVPDLIVWNVDKGEARFVEVKGPGDTLSETQKIWIDVLLSAGVPVEVCRVRDKADEARDSAKGKGKAGRKRKASAGEP